MCCELTRGAAQVVDTMESPHAEVLRVQRECLQMTSGMTMEDIQQALKVECGVCDMSGHGEGHRQPPLCCTD